MTKETQQKLNDFKAMLESDLKAAKKFHDRKAEWLITSYLASFLNTINSIDE